MIPCISKEIPRERLERVIALLRVCKVCRRGFFRGMICPQCIESINSVVFELITVREYVKVELFYTVKKIVKKTKKRKKIVIIKIVSKKCFICGEDSGRRMCCSDICEVRKSSSYYDNGERCFISVEKAQERMEGIIERRRLRDLEKNCG